LELFVSVAAGIVVGGYILSKIVRVKPAALQDDEDAMDAKVRKAGYLGMEDLIQKAREHMYTPNGNGDPLFIFLWEQKHAERDALCELARDHSLLEAVRPDSAEREDSPWMNDWWRLPRDHSGFEVLMVRFAPRYVADWDDTPSHNWLARCTMDGVEAAIGGIVVRLKEASIPEDEIYTTLEELLT
jgi:hypothetical protein